MTFDPHSVSTNREMLKETLRRERREEMDILTIVEKSIGIKIPSERVLEMLTLDACESVECTSRERTPRDKYRVGVSDHVAEKHTKYDLESTESARTMKT